MLGKEGSQNQCALGSAGDCASASKMEITEAMSDVNVQPLHACAHISIYTHMYSYINMQTTCIHTCHTHKFLERIYSSREGSRKTWNNTVCPSVSVMLDPMKSFFTQLGTIPPTSFFPAEDHGQVTLHVPSCAHSCMKVPRILTGFCTLTEAGCLQSPHTEAARPYMTWTLVTSRVLDIQKGDVPNILYLV